MPQCTARSKRTHEQCRQWAMHGCTTCYHHGGDRSGRPVTHGRRSRRVRELHAKLDAWRRQDSLSELARTIERVLNRRFPLLLAALDRCVATADVEGTPDSRASFRSSVAGMDVIREMSRTGMDAAIAVGIWIGTHPDGPRLFRDYVDVFDEHNPMPPPGRDATPCRE